MIEMTPEQHREHKSVIEWYRDSPVAQHIYPQLERFFKEQEDLYTDMSEEDLIL